MGNIDLLGDACARIPHTSRKMFGGHGLFAPNGGMFAGIVTDDEIILKLAEDAARAELEALGGHAWVYNGKMTMKEWIVIPDRFYDEPQTLAAWAKRAHGLAPGKAFKGLAKGAKRAKSAKTTAVGAPAAPARAAKKAALPKASAEAASRTMVAKATKNAPASKARAQNRTKRR